MGPQMCWAGSAPSCPCSHHPPMAYSSSDLAGDRGTSSAPLNSSSARMPCLSARSVPQLPRPKEAARSCWNSREAAAGGLGAAS